MIDLTYLKCSAATPTLMNWSASMEPVLGGITQKIDRLGARFSIDFTTPTLRIEADGRYAIADLQQAQRLGGYVYYPQPDFDVGSPGSPTVSGAHTGGTSLLIRDATPRYAVRKGQALNLTVGGRRYLYFAAANAILDGAGAGTVLLTTPMRKHMAGGEAVTLARPVIEGWMDGNERSWTLETARTTGLEFTIMERA